MGWQKNGSGSKLGSPNNAGLAEQGHMQRECGYVFATVRFCASMHPISKNIEKAE